MDENRVKDPLGHYEELRAKTGPAPFSDLGALARIAALIVLISGSVGLIVYRLLF